MNIQEANEIVREWFNVHWIGGNGDLNLDGLTSAVGLTLPESVGGDLSLDGLTSAVGLTLPISIREAVWLRDLPLADNEALRKRHPNLADKIK